MFLHSDFQTEADPASRAQVIALLESLGHVDKGIAILGRAPQTYMSTVLVPDTGLFSLDFRNGEPRQHYSVQGLARQTVVDAFLSYFDDDNRWKTMVEWERDPHYELIQG